jgi:hypothetical protein
LPCPAASWRGVEPLKNNDFIRICYEFFFL